MALHPPTSAPPSLHDALPIFTVTDVRAGLAQVREKLGSFQHDGRTFWHAPGEEPPSGPQEPSGHLLQILDEMYRGYQDSRDRKSTRLNSSHPSISYAVFCLKK